MVKKWTRKKQSIQQKFTDYLLNSNKNIWRYGYNKDLLKRFTAEELTEICDRYVEMTKRSVAIVNDKYRLIILVDREERKVKLWGWEHCSKEKLEQIKSMYYDEKTASEYFLYKKKKGIKRDI